MRDGKRCACVMLMAGILAGMISCEAGRRAEIPAGAEILGETTVATVNGCRVGSGNFFETGDPSGKRRMSIMVSVWRPGSPDGSAKNSTVFEGDTFMVCGREYRLVLVEPGKKGDIGTAYIVMVDK